MLEVETEISEFLVDVSAFPEVELVSYEWRVVGVDLVTRAGCGTRGGEPGACRCHSSQTGKELLRRRELS